MSPNSGVSLSFDEMRAAIEAKVGPLVWHEREHRLEAANYEFLLIQPAMGWDEAEGMLAWGGIEMFGDHYNLALVGLFNLIMDPENQVIRSLQRPPQCVIDAARKHGKEISVSGDCIPYVEGSHVA